MTDKTPTPRTITFSSIADPNTWKIEGESKCLVFASPSEAKRAEELFNEMSRELSEARAECDAELARLKGQLVEQKAIIEALMAGSMVASDEGVIPVIRRIELLQEQLALAYDAINDALPWMIKLGDYIGNGTQADPMGRCNAILKMRIAVEKRDD